MIHYVILDNSIISNLRRSAYHNPVVAFGESPDVHSVVSSMRYGADYFIDVHDLSSVEGSIITMERELKVSETYSNLSPCEFSSECASLSNREKEVLNLISEGHTSKSIGRILRISHRTVDVHRSNIMKKTKSPRITSAVHKNLHQNFNNEQYSARF